MEGVSLVLYSRYWIIIGVDRFFYIITSSQHLFRCSIHSIHLFLELVKYLKSLTIVLGFKRSGLESHHIFY